MNNSEDTTGVEQDHEQATGTVDTILTRIAKALVMIEFIIIVLKVLGLVGWSWLWILAPIWIPFAILSISFIVYGMWSAFTEK